MSDLPFLLSNDLASITKKKLFLFPLSPVLLSLSNPTPPPASSCVSFPSPGIGGPSKSPRGCRGSGEGHAQGDDNSPLPLRHLSCTCHSTPFRAGDAR